MTTQSTEPVAFQRPPQPVLSGGNEAYTLAAINSLVNAIQSTQRLTPQPATVAPLNPTDAMWRLARQPWQPLKARLGITADCWVYYDSSLPGWRHIGENPTNT